MTATFNLSKNKLSSERRGATWTKKSKRFSLPNPKMKRGIVWRYIQVYKEQKKSRREHSRERRQNEISNDYKINASALLPDTSSSPFFFSKGWCPRMRKLTQTAVWGWDGWPTPICDLYYNEFSIWARQTLEAIIYTCYKDAFDCR